MKITMIGRKGSGKTSFLGGICDTFVQRSSCNFKIRMKRHNDNYGDNVKQRRLMVGEIGKLSIRDRGFSNATEDTTLWLLEMLHGNDRVCDFEWVDYRGGAIDDCFRDCEKEDSDLITAHIANSDAVMVFVDSISLSYFSHDIEQAMYFSGADRIYQFFDTMVDEFKKRDLVVLFVLSKVDSNEIPDELTTSSYSGLKDLCKEVYVELINLGRLNGWKFGIIPTGVVGKNKVHTTINTNVSEYFSANNNIIQPGIVSPLNIDTALFYCIKKVLEVRRTETDSRTRNLENNIENIIENASGIYDFWKKINGQKTSKELAVELMRRRNEETSELIRLEGVLNTFPNEKLKEVLEVW